MKRFKFPLQSLLDYRRHRRDLCRQLLAQLLSDDAALEAQRAALLAERDRHFESIRELSRPGRVSVDAAATRRYHSGQLMLEADLVARNRELLGRQLDACRQATIKADVEVRAIERLEEKARAAHAYEAERQAQHEREDAWSAGRLLENRR